MTTYKLTGQNHVIRDGIASVSLYIDGEYGPTAEQQAYFDWLAAGNEPEDAALDPFKAEARDQITAERNRREQGGFDFSGRPIDSDLESCIRISGAASAAHAALAMQQPFSVDWTCADNSVLSLDAYGVIGMLAALATHSNSMHQQARAYKQQVDDAETVAEVQAVLDDALTEPWPAENEQ